jgi:thiol-disulfide isomerase/thioredoxin
MPTVRFRSLDGRWVRPDEPGVVYVLNFWTTFCPPCLEELPSLLTLSKELPVDGSARILAVNTEGLSGPSIKRFLEARQLSGLPVFTDPEDGAEAIGVRGIPLTVILKNNRVLGVHLGYAAPLMDELREQIRRGASAAPEA